MAASRKSAVEELREDLQRIREEVRLKIHLAAADARDEWDDLDKKWHEFRSRVERIGDEARHTTEDVGEALELAGEELRKGFQRIRRMI